MCASCLSFGVLSAPKAGFLPTIAGIAAVMLTVLVVISGQWTVNEKQERVYWRKFILIIAGLIFYLLCFTVGGFRAATFLIMLYLLKVMEFQGWTLSIVISGVVTVVFYTIFSGFLGISLP
jgi:hypothetical protein